MLIPNQKIKVQWRYQNRAYYRSLGYEFTNWGDSFYVNPEEVPKGSSTKIGFICDYCNKEFYTTSKNYHRWGHTYFGEYKCAKCYQKNINVYSQEARTNYIYEKVMYICNKYGYRLITPKEDIVNSECMIEYECPIHGVQSRRAHLFIYGEHICPECNRNNKKLTIEYVSKTIRDRGAKLLNPEDYQGTTVPNLSVVCANCGSPFITSYNSFMFTRNKDAQLCPDCTASSMGEAKIKKYLKNSGIRYIPQKRFNDCKDSRQLPFDFYLPDYNWAIEYDGKQHFEATSFSKDVDAQEYFEYVKKHDNIKNQYCRDHGIFLIRIPYYDYDRIEEILEQYLYSHEDIV